jgi:plasmid stabilization system protein ParE
VSGLTWTEGAIADLDRIRRYVTAVDPHAARRLADRIEAVVTALESEGVASADVAERPIVYPYLLRYTGQAGGVTITAVRHASSALIV